MLTNTDIGTACYFGEVVARIIEHVEGCAVFNNIHSQVVISTPHGSVVNSGIAHLDVIDEEGLKRLKEFEEDAIAKGTELYKGKLIKQNI